MYSKSRSSEQFLQYVRRYTCSPGVGQVNSDPQYERRDTCSPGVGQVNRAIFSM